VFNLGMGEIVVILILALIFLGPKKLPDLAAGLGKAIREIRKATSDLRNEIDLDETIRKPLEELRDAATLPPEELKRQDRERGERERREAEEARHAKDELVSSAAGSVGPAAANPLVVDSAWKPYEAAPPSPPPPPLAGPAPGAPPPLPRRVTPASGGPPALPPSLPRPAPSTRPLPPRVAGGPPPLPRDGSKKS
jgi:Tat protein translocase TatB subunit